MKQGAAFILGVLMLGSAWELGTKDSSSGGSSPSMFGNVQAGKTRVNNLKALSKAAAKKPTKEAAGAKPDSDDSDGEVMKAEVAVVAAAAADGLKAAAVPSGKGAAPAQAAVAALALAKTVEGGGDLGLKSQLIWRQTEVKGSLSKDLVTRTLKKRVSRLKYCHEQQLKGNPNVKGTVSVSFAVSRSGRVKAAKLVETTLNDRSMERCVLSQFRRTRFPRSKRRASTSVTAGLEFKPAGQ
jgi:hypothetical protein